MALTLNSGAVDLSKLMPSVFQMSPLLVDYMTCVSNIYWTVQQDTAGLYNLVNPYTCPSKYLQYLADLVGLQLRSSTYLSSLYANAQQMQLINAVQWYKIKGTYSGLTYLGQLLGLNLNIQTFWCDNSTDYNNGVFVSEPYFVDTTGSSYPANLSTNSSISVSYLVVAGGGAGGNGDGGGGGGGGVLTGSSTLTYGGIYPVVVGLGGTISANVGGNGTASTFNGMNTVGGGGGGGNINSDRGNSGGSGGGGCGANNDAPNHGTGTAGQGHDGGDGHFGSNAWAGGGGGGANAVGSNGAASTGGNGGAGITSSISGSPVVYGSGGGGGTVNGGTAGTGGTNAGNGAANNGITAGSGIANRGGGGGGGNDNGDPAGAGGSGVVVLSYSSSGVVDGTGGTITHSGGNTIHTFTSGGTFVAPTSSSVYFPTPHYGIYILLNQVYGTYPSQYLWNDAPFSDLLYFEEQNRAVHLVPHFFLQLSPQGRESGAVVEVAGNIYGAVDNWSYSTNYYDQLYTKTLTASFYTGYAWGVNVAGDIVPGTVKLYTNSGTLIAQDNGSGGGWVSAASGYTFSGSVNYSTGAVKATITPSQGSAPYITYEQNIYDNSLIYDESYSTFLSSIQNWKLGTGNINATNPPVAGVTNIVLSGSGVTLQQFPTYNTFTVTLPLNTVQSGITELGLYTTGNTLVFVAYFPSIQLTGNESLNIVVQINKN